MIIKTTSSSPSIGAAEPTGHPAPTRADHGVPDAPEDRTNRRRLNRVGAFALVAGAALQFAGLASSHPEMEPGRAAYLAASAAEPLRTQISALLLHYGAVGLGLGVLVAPGLVRGRRGAALTLIGALTATLFLVNLSGALFVDWVHLQLGLDLPADIGAALSDRMYDHGLLEASFGLAPLIAVGLILVFVGLARALVVGWWTVPAVVVGYAGMLLLPYSMPILPALGSLPMLIALGQLGLAAVQDDRQTDPEDEVRP